MGLASRSLCEEHDLCMLDMCPSCLVVGDKTPADPELKSCATQQLKHLAKHVE